jgi:UDPglucose--hexose-1-phosphate uridylyltransferase
MIEFDLPHRRYNPLADEWVLVSPHRTQRPWQGQVEKSEVETRPSKDSNCYLCPGSVRANGEQNPEYAGTYVFQNDFAALVPSVEPSMTEGLFRAESVRGECRVICFSPRHDLTLADMPLEDVLNVVETWCCQSIELGQRYRWVQIFENKGAIMGCSNPHPHGQIWASDSIPTFTAREQTAQLQHYRVEGMPLLTQVAGQELRDGRRVVAENSEWLLVVPFWATWPFEYLLLPKTPTQRMTDLTSEQKGALSQILLDGLGKYDRLFQTSFPYTMGWHGAPYDGEDHPEWILHAHFYPPLLRSATVKKFMVGYEMLGEAQRDLTPESAAERLRHS